MGLEKIIAVIVLYKTSLENSVTFKTLLKSIDLKNEKLTLLVYNNSPDYWNFDGTSYDGLDIIYVCDNFNSGVSKAYNVAFDYGKKLNKRYLLLLDQDTKISKSFFDSFFNVEQKYSNKNLGLFSPMIMNQEGLISPAKFFFYTSKKIESIEEGEHSLHRLAIINSGLIVSTKLFELVGGYNEKIKLDFSDFYFLKRVLKFEKKVIIFNSKCYHSLSSEEEISLKNALNRFDYYIVGAKYYSRSFGDTIGLNLWVFLRSVKLGIKYKTTKFTRKIFT